MPYIEILRRNTNVGHVHPVHIAAVEERVHDIN